MYETISTKNMTHEDWLYLRKSGIGGSDAGAVCGLNPYASPMSVYHDKISDELNLADSESMRQGRDLEEYVARRFMEASGKRVCRSNKMYRSKEYPFMLADIDRLVVGEDAGLECKTASAYLADKWKDGEVPPHYLIQCLHYMAVTGRNAWYLAVVILGQGFQYVKIERDEDMICNLISIEQSFWQDHVVPAVMPDPDGSKACDAVLEQYFGTARKGEEMPLIGFDKKLERRAQINDLIETLEQEKKQIEQEVKLYMKDCERAASEHYRVTWSNVETARLDTKGIKAQYPEVYRDFLHSTVSRRFVVKAA